MKKIERYVYEDSDYELLNEKLPSDPCLKCSNHIGCCGCSEGKEYEKVITKYEEAGIYDIACIVTDIMDQQIALAGLECKMKKSIDSLESTDVDLSRIKVYNSVKQKLNKLDYSNSSTDEIEKVKAF